MEAQQAVPPPGAGEAGNFGRLSSRACLAMIAVDCLVGIAVLIVKLWQHYPRLEYAQLLATYQFGVIRRALVGEVWFLLSGGGTVPVRDVFLLGGTFIAAAVILFLLVFHSVYRISADSLPLFVFTFGSPFWLKNFVFSIGYFDVLGCIAALVALVLPLGSLYMPVIGLLSILLLFVHHIHFFLYLPAIATIVLIRHRAVANCDLRFAGWVTAISLIAIAAVVYLGLFGRPTVSPEEFLQNLRSRALDPIYPNVLVIWYSTLSQEIANTMSLLPQNGLRFPIFAILIFLHAPLIGYFRRVVGNLAHRVDRLIVLACVAAIALGYLVILVVGYDYSRWVSNWAVCMMLVMFAASLLPSRGSATIEPTARNAAFAWALTVIPRVGITYPF